MKGRRKLVLGTDTVHGGNFRQVLAAGLLLARITWEPPSQARTACVPL